MSLREDLDEEHPVFDPPDLPDDIGAAARISREWLDLEDTNNFDSYRAAVEARGILVFRSNGYAGKWQIKKESSVAGFALYDEVCPVILVKKEAAETRQTFTLMHELGHLLQHRTSFVDEFHDLHSYQGHEREANEFAGQLLVPEENLAEIDMDARPRSADQFDAWLAPQRKKWGVSGEVIVLRLVDHRMLSRVDYAAYRRWNEERVFPTKDGGSREYRHREPKHVFGETFVRTVLDALHARQITLARASSYLDNLKIRDIHKLERHYAGV